MLALGDKLNLQRLQFKTADGEEPYEIAGPLDLGTFTQFPVSCPTSFKNFAEVRKTAAS